jgi:hypothetical protein
MNKNITFGLALISMFTIGVGVAYFINQKPATTVPEVKGVSEISSYLISSDDSIVDKDIPILD